LTASLAGGGVFAQDPTAEREALDVQRAHERRVKQRGEKVYYTQRWNLDDLPAYEPGQKVSGKVRIWGLNYLTEGLLAKYWEDGFRRYHPEAQLEYFTPTTLVAVPGLYLGLADLGASRRITWDELLAFQRLLGYHPLEIEMATGSFNVPGWNPALAIFVHKDNPISRLTLTQLDGIFGAARDGGWNGMAWDSSRARGPEGNLRTWGQLGLTGEWKDRRINVHGRPLKHHLQLEIERKVFKGGDKWNEDLHEYAHDVRPDGSQAITAQEILVALSQDRYGIAFSDMGYPMPEIKTVALGEKEGGPYAELTIENVRNRTYPLFTENYFYVNRKPGTSIEAKVKEYLRYVLSREGQDAVQRDGKYLPLTAVVLRQQRSKLE